jgi:hypothetical protein
VCIVWNISVMTSHRDGCSVRRRHQRPHWRERLVCSRCRSRRVDMVARVKCVRSPLLPPLQWPASGVGKVRQSERHCTGFLGALASIVPLDGS